MLLLLACLLAWPDLTVAKHRQNTKIYHLLRFIHTIRLWFCPNGTSHGWGGGRVRVGGGASGQIDSIYTSVSMAAWRDAVVIVMLAGATFPAA